MSSKQQPTRWRSGVIVMAVMLAVFVESASAQVRFRGRFNRAKAAPTSVDVAAKVDSLIEAELEKNGTPIAAVTSDDDFLRRISLDLAGASPSTAEVTLFALDFSEQKRTKLIDQLLASSEFGQNMARYWRDVIFNRATNQRALLGVGEFESWMAEQITTNQPWDKIVTDLLTATGDVRENGATAIMIAHEGQPAEIAAETSRIFLGIQMQCANCHDHPTDSWTRDQFHQLAAFFPRIGVRPKQVDGMLRSFEIVSVNAARRQGNRFNSDFLFNRMDRNRDGKLTKNEVAGLPQLAQNFDRLLERIDTDKDGALSREEAKNFQPPPNNRPGQGSLEHRMPDLANPSSEGTQINPVFFATGAKAKPGLTDLGRRELLAKYLTTSDNPWFARAFVNRVWAEMLGEGFYMPVDDLGPERAPSFPAVLETLCQAFRDNRFDIKWLYRTIAVTKTYQRQISNRDRYDGSIAFGSAAPTRLRADQIYTSLVQVLGFDESQIQTRGRGMGGGGGRYGRRGPRAAFAQLFGFDPSTPQEDITGNVPQALFMMNSSLINGFIRANGDTKLSRILKKHSNNEDAVREVYLLALARDPSAKELKISLDYISEVGSRGEAFEDLMWSLLNSSEFISKR